MVCLWVGNKEWLGFSYVTMVMDSFLSVIYFFTSGAEPVQLNVPSDEYYSKKITNKIVQQIHVIITFWT